MSGAPAVAPGSKVRAGIDPALLVVLAGISAALHVGKLPPAIPVLREALGISLVQAGFLLSLVQLAGMVLGVFVGLAADSLGQRRTMVAGLLILAGASLLGGLAGGPGMLLALRGLEGLGFLLATLPAPGLIRRLVEPARLSARLGWWGAYMPVGTSSALLAGPAVIALAGWPGWWWLLGALSLVMGLWVLRALPPSLDVAAQSAGHGVLARLGRTLRQPGPWLASLGFAAYSAQWLSVIGFLPTIYAQAGIAPVHAALATAFAAGVNMTGNISSGRLLQRRVAPEVLISCGFLAMGAGAIVAFAPWIPEGTGGAVLRYGGVLLFSAVGGLIPGTLFSLAVRLAPDEGTVSTTVGWMQQWSSLGQFAGPPLVALVAAWSGGWQSMGWVTAGLAGLGLLIAALLGRLLRAGAGGAR